MKKCGENNENIVKYYESYQTENEFAIVLELCDFSLTKFKKNRIFGVEEIHEILNQLNNAFKIMKEKSIVHRDLKPDNILINNFQYIIKLSDFGTSKNVNFTKLRSHKGTVAYMAPEIMELEEGDIYDDKCDLWSLGIIIYELFFGERPYKALTEGGILKQINNSGKMLIKKTNNNELDDLINKLLEKDPEKRIEWEEYFNHPFFNEITITYKINENKKVKIFGNEFVENNKSKCRMKYKEKDYDLLDYFEIEDDEELLEIKLFGINNITDMSYLFSCCEMLESLSDIYKWNTKNVTNMSHMFYNCKSLKELERIHRWNTKNVINMSHMFYNCESLKYLEIGKWDIENVTNMSYMFFNCKSLIYFDYLKFYPINVTNMSYMFYNCESLKI